MYMYNQIFLNAVIEHQAYHSTQQQTENLPMLEEHTKSETQSRNVQQHNILMDTERCRRPSR